MTLSREDRSLLTEWWFTVDRLQLSAIAALMVTGLIISLAASPSVAIKKELPAFYFVQRHMLYAVVGAVLILFFSLLAPAAIRRAALLIYTISSAALIAVLIWGAEINGAQRWIFILGISVQPSEIAKPAFVVLAGWAFGEAQKRKDMPGLPIAIGLYLILAGLLIMQPDVGQTVLVSAVWGTLFLLAGLPLIWFCSFLGIGTAGAFAAYWNLPYVQRRIDQYFAPILDKRSQPGQARESFIDGGFFGRGPGEGTIKTTLPDAHTDFIFAVIAEEYGVLACLALLGLFAFIVYRALGRAVLEDDLGIRYGIAGLALLFGYQTLINMGVNVGLLPAKGMTLPMISAGGSSTIGISITLGMMLALSRRRPRVSSTRLSQSQRPY
ncbi:MAG: putative peptidoglycan glycosyltransferase FtsW [Pseudomonadota bacterium]